MWRSHVFGSADPCILLVSCQHATVMAAGAQHELGEDKCCMTCNGSLMSAHPDAAVFAIGILEQPLDLLRANPLNGQSVDRMYFTCQLALSAFTIVLQATKAYSSTWWCGRK
jgi:hypothetical protein